MFSRISQNEELVSKFPKEMNEKITDALTNELSQQLIDDQRYFFSYGEIYSQEILSVISLLHQTEVQQSPVTLYLSVELDKSNFDIKIIDEIVAFAISVFEEVSRVSDWNEYSVIWQKTNLHSTEAHYKISRENIQLTLEANKILDLNP